MNKTKQTEELKLSLGKPFSNDFGTIYFLKCHMKPEIFNVSIQSAKVLPDDKNKFAAPNKFTLILSPEQKKNIDIAATNVKKLVAIWHKISVGDRKLQNFTKESELQTVSLSKAQQEANTKDTLDGTDLELMCDSLFIGTNGQMYL